MRESLEVLKFPDSRLRNKGQKVSRVTEDLKVLAQAMLDTMYSMNGVGLAAIQVNKPFRLFVADTSSGEDRYEKSSLSCELEKSIKGPLVFFNPEIISLEGKVVFPEGCLSFPSYFAEVQRAQVVEVRALDMEGKSFSLKTDGLLSICIQHEIDHLDGKLFIDHLSPAKAQQLRNKIKKYGYPAPAKNPI